MEAVVGEPDPFGAEETTVAIFAGADGYVVHCCSPRSWWAASVINIRSEEVIAIEDFEP